MNLKDMIFVSLFTAIIGVLAIFPPIVTPFTPLPITAQTLGVMMAGGILGAKRGGLSLLIFLLLLAVGAPLASGGRGGLAVLFGPGGGYILAWPLAAWTIGYLTERNLLHLKLWKLFVFNFLGGIVIVYIIGISYMAVISQLAWGPTALSSLVFLPGDLTKVVIASLITLKVHQVYPALKEKNEHEAA